jgi:hypothetical protein
MPKTTAFVRATKSHTPLHTITLSVVQENAIDALVTGKNDTETAELVGVDRTTITRWRLYSPHFQAALNVRRAEVWSVGAARLQALLPKAIDVLAEYLEDEDNFPQERFKAALELLRLVPLGRMSIGPTDPDEIVRERVEELRKRTEEEKQRLKDAKDDEFTDSIDELPPMPTTGELTAAVLKEIDARLEDPGTGK